jgi:predicted amidohydrolase YtcJ
MTDSREPAISRMQDGPQKADLVIENGRVFSGDAVVGEATALAISAGRITAIGTRREIASSIDRDTRIIDALGRRIVPGLNDSHLHTIRGGLNYLLELRWDGVGTLAEALTMLREQVMRTPPGQWVRVVGGWSPNQFAERRMPTLRELNEISPDVPVFVLHMYESALLNQAAIKALGYRATTPDPPGGKIVRGASGNPTGLLLAKPAATLLYSTLAKAPTLDSGDQIESTRHFLRELNRYGITSVLDPGGGFQSFPENYAAVRELAKRGALTARITYYLFPQSVGQELDDLRRFTRMVRPGDGDEWLRVGGAGENLTWAGADYENFAEPRPALPPDAPTELQAAMRLLFEAGWGFRKHATYGETIERDLDVLDAVAADIGVPRDVTWFFDHAETVSERSLDRIANLGGSLSIQNRMMFQGEAFVQRYGARAASAAPPIGAMRSRGLLVAAGTDGTRVSSYNPWLSLEWLVTGRTIGGRPILAREHRLDRPTALQMYTAAGATLTGENDRKGRLLPGAFADLAILSDDYFTVDDADISRIESVLTVAGGQIVHASGPFEGAVTDLPFSDLTWSPVRHFGGFRPDNGQTGARQAQAVADVASESIDQTAWRQSKKLGPPSPDLPINDELC